MRVERWREDVVPVPERDAERYRAAGCWAGRTIPQQFHLVAGAHPDRPSVITETATLSYRELDEHTDRIAAGLVELGFEPGAAVLLQIENSMDAVLAWYGLIKAGLVPVATLASHRGHEIGQIGALTEAAGHVVDDDHPKTDLVEFAQRMARESGASRHILTIGGGARRPGTIALTELGRDLSAAGARAVVDRVAAGIDGDDVAVFQLSGGTTSTPKVIPRLHDDYWHNAHAYAGRLGWDATTLVAHALPLIHNAGIVCALHAAHSVGGAFVVGNPAAERLLPLMAASGTTDIMMFPPMALDWSRHPAFGDMVAPLRRIVLTGTKVPDAAFTLFEGHGVRVLGLFGAGEGLVTVTDPDAPPEFRQHCLGTPVSPLDEVRVLAPGTEDEVPDGTTGELCFTGPTTLRGYLRSPERNAEAFTSDGLYRSGDLVTARTVAGRRTYTFEGRAKDVVQRGGEKVNSAEIEGLVMGMPTVARAALIPVPDERLGERACLCLEIVPGAGPPTLTEVAAFLAEREVAKFKWPERLEILDAIPLTRIGKIDKRALVERVTAGAPS